ncbi:hypothetical protein D3C72_1948580 [compost metagenome]
MRNHGRDAVGEVEQVRQLGQGPLVGVKGQPPGRQLGVRAQPIVVRQVSRQIDAVGRGVILERQRLVVEVEAFAGPGDVLGRVLRPFMVVFGQGRLRHGASKSGVGASMLAHPRRVRPRSKQPTRV